MVSGLEKLHHSTKVAVKTGIQAVKNTYRALQAPQKAFKNKYTKQIKNIENMMYDPITNGHYRHNGGEPDLYIALTAIGLPVSCSMSAGESFVTTTIPEILKNMPLFEAGKAFYKEMKK